MSKLTFNDYVGFHAAIAELAGELTPEYEDVVTGYQAIFVFTHSRRNFRAIVTETFTSLEVCDEDWEQIQEAGTENPTPAWLNEQVAIALSN